MLKKSHTVYKDNKIVHLLAIKKNYMLGDAHVSAPKKQKHHNFITNH